MTTNRLLSFAGCSKQPAQPVFAHDVLREVANQVQPTVATGVTIQLELNARNQVVVVNRDLLRQALHAVIINAITAVGDDGTVLVRTRDLSDPVTGVALVVIDDGVGMEPEVQAKAIGHISPPVHAGLVQAWGSPRRGGLSRKPVEPWRSPALLARVRR